MAVKKGNIHDENFKHNFSSEEVAREFLKYNLPKKLLKEVDINTLTIEPNELIPSRYRSKRNADIIYSLKDRNGSTLYALVHLEAQSRHDKYMALRVWEYHVAIARYHLRRGHRKVPTILTFVLYHGRQPWMSARSISELFENFEIYVELSIKQPFLLDLTKAQTKQLKAQGAAAAPQLIMQGHAKGDFCSSLSEIYPLMKKHGQIDEENVDYMACIDIHGWRGFLDELSKFDEATANDFKTMFKAAIKKDVDKGVEQRLKKIEMEALKLGEEKGIKLGEEKGIKLGEQRGIKEGRKRAILDLVVKGVVTQKVADEMLKETN